MSFLVFATSGYGYFQAALCEHSGFEAGQLRRTTFPDEERYLRLEHSVRGRDVVVCGGTVSDAETVELFDIGCGLVQHGARGLTLVVPYFGYSTMERATKPGEIVTGKNRALLLSSIPKAHVGNEILMVDLHTGGIPHYFEGHLRPYHIYAKRLIGEILRGFGDLQSLVLASTDAGRAKWVESLAAELKVPAALVYKRRHGGSDTEIRGINADVAGRHVVIYDDMIRTGGSLIQAARAYRDAGATGITAIATHGVFAKGSLQRLEQTRLFNHVITTDTHPHAVKLAAEVDGNFFRLHSVIPDIAKFLMEPDAYGSLGFLDT